MRTRIGLLIAVFVLAAAASSQGAILTGSFSIGGYFRPVTCTAACVVADLQDANAIDVTDNTGVASPGVAGPIKSGSATGSFASLVPNGSIGSLRDFSFSGPGSVQFPLAPIASFELFPAITFNLASISGTANNIFVNLTGFGTFLCNTPGVCDATPGMFVLSGQTADNVTFSFSASEAATVPVPEWESTMTFFAIGLLGLAAARYRVSGR
jgi:hypothetical protein